jgi:hypothetical protein
LILTAIASKPCAKPALTEPETFFQDTASGSVMVCEVLALRITEEIAVISSASFRHITHACGSFSRCRQVNSLYHRLRRTPPNQSYLLSSNLLTPLSRHQQRQRYTKAFAIQFYLSTCETKIHVQPPRDAHSNTHRQVRQ